MYILKYFHQSLVFSLCTDNWIMQNWVDRKVRGGEWGKQGGSMYEESQVRGCYNITFIYTSQETVSVLKKKQANKTFWTWKQT